jgi:N-acetylglutamate synthase/N-acetylornithine aminotransferase
VVGGAFTKNVVCAAPVTYCKNLMAEKDTIRAILINAGQVRCLCHREMRCTLSKLLP